MVTSPFSTLLVRLLTSYPPSTPNPLDNYPPYHLVSVLQLGAHEPLASITLGVNPNG